MASELINELDKKRRGGNIAIKIDIQQAYDSLEWDFPKDVLMKVGMSQTVIQYIAEIMSSTRVAMMVNVEPVEFFEVTRGLKQGDPLSPSLFAIAKEVLRF